MHRSCLLFLFLTIGLLACSSDSLVEPVSRGDLTPAFIGTDNDYDGIENAVDNCPNAYNPDQSDLDNDGVGDVCEEDHGVANGDGELRHEPSSDRPLTRSRFHFDLDAGEENGDLSVPLAAFGDVYFLSLGPSHAATDDLEFTSSSIEYLEVNREENGTGSAGILTLNVPHKIFAAGEGTLNGESGWGFCMIARDTRTRGKQGKTGDRLMMRLFDGDSSCPEPDYNFLTVVTVGDINAESEGGGGRF